jgi:hypothetical protein
MYIELSKVTAIIDELVAWGFLEEHFDARGTRWSQLTALGHQHGRFREAPHEEPSFLSAWIAAFERLHRGVRPDDEALLKGVKIQAASEGIDRAAARLRASKAAWRVYAVAKRGDIPAFHHALMMLEEEAP